LLRKCTKTVATRAAPFGSDICTKLFVGWGFAPDPLGELTSLPRRLAGLGVGPTGNGKEGGGKEGGDGVPECPNPELACLSPNHTSRLVPLHKPSAVRLLLRLLRCVSLGNGERGNGSVAPPSWIGGTGDRPQW